MTPDATPAREPLDLRPIRKRMHRLVSLDDVPKLIAEIEWLRSRVAARPLDRDFDPDRRVQMEPNKVLAVRPVGIPVKAQPRPLHVEPDEVYCDSCGAAVAEIRCEKCVAARPLQGAWQPIETAPKDGTAIRLKWKRTTVEAIGRWCPAVEWPKPFASDDWRDVEGDDVLLMPTHWMPIPASPSDGAQEQNGKS